MTTPNKLKIPKQEILNDYQIAIESREASYVGRKEVFMGKAKFGVFGDGKELPQIAMARVFRHGDFRSGYYRDQTLMMAMGQLSVQAFFAQLYAHTDLEAEPASVGRMMNGHFGTRWVDENGDLKPLTAIKNSTSDLSPTSAQIPRLLGLAYASKLFRGNPELKDYKDLSIEGNEVAFGTIGNAATSEGAFLEAMNAAGVLQVPLVVAVWDDGYGISVPEKYHSTKGSISKMLAGLQRSEEEKGIEILTVKGWDYLALRKTFDTAERISRKEHVPILVHVTELTQPQGHSTSGSHERYKSKQRLAWEAEYDCIKQMRAWMLTEDIATEKALEEIESAAQARVKSARTAAWNAYRHDLQVEIDELLVLLRAVSEQSPKQTELLAIAQGLKATANACKLDLTRSAKQALRFLRTESSPSKDRLTHWFKQNVAKRQEEYNSHVYSESQYAALRVKPKPPIYSENSATVDGRQVLQACFDQALTNNPLLFIIGEDVGKIGDVNQGLAGLQEKHGEWRVTDTGIRETTIVGQGIGAALRGMRPIVEIQYLDYLLYALQILSDDVACLQYRTKGGQRAPLIIRTRGHRLEGVWHSGSPMGMAIHALRGIFVLVPRNMTQAAGMYNTLLASDDAALLVECLNGYRLKERLPDNVGEFKIPLGVPEVIHTGTDITIVTYGAMCRIAIEAAEQLAEYDISAEVIDIQTLLPFDRQHIILNSIKKTNRLMVADEDVPGGASSFMLQQILEGQNAYQYLDSAPMTVTAAEHRTAYGSDGDYYSKPNAEDLFDKAYEAMSEADPAKYPPFSIGQ